MKVSAGFCLQKPDMKTEPVYVESVRYTGAPIAVWFAFATQLGIAVHFPIEVFVATFDENGTPVGFTPPRSIPNGPVPGQVGFVFPLQVEAPGSIVVAVRVGGGNQHECRLLIRRES